MPSPTDPASAPVWDNYIVSQAAQAALGQLPRNALAAGVLVDGQDVRLVFRLSAETPDDVSSMGDIADDLSALVGDDVRVTSSRDVVPDAGLPPHDGVRWFFLARLDRGCR